MTLQSSGAISLGNVNTELGRSATANISLGETAVRTLAGVSSGAISLASLYGKSNAPVFDPVGSEVASGAPQLNSYGTTSAEITLTANQNVNWYWSLSGNDAYASLSSGGTGSSIVFSQNNFGFDYLYSTFSVYAVGGGITRYWRVDLSTTGFN